jgi:hypothetical protein
MLPRLCLVFLGAQNKLNGQCGLRDTVHAWVALDYFLTQKYVTLAFGPTGENRTYNGIVVDFGRGG